MNSHEAADAVWKILGTQYFFLNYILMLPVHFFLELSEVHD